MSHPLSGRRIVIAGGSGFLGLSLAHQLAACGAEISVLSRTPPRGAGPWRHVAWDGRALGHWQDVLDGAAGLVNLAGRSVDCVKTPDHQDEILRSRVESTRVLGEALRQVQQAPPVWIQMSTAHLYGDPPTVVCTEDSPPGYGLAPFVGRSWEAAFQDAILPEQRGVVLRTSFVLGRNRGAGGGALSTLARLAKLGLGGRIGRGTQGISWLHERDLGRLVERGLVDDSMRGAYIASAPQPVPQVEFMRALRRAVRMPIGLPAPSWLVRLGARLVLRTDPDLALYGRFVRSRRLADEGFEFEFPEVGEALLDLLKARTPT